MKKTALSRRGRRTDLALVVLLGAGLVPSLVSAQSVISVRALPAQPATAAPAPIVTPAPAAAQPAGVVGTGVGVAGAGAPPAPLSAAEIEDIKADFADADATERDAMRAYYKDLGVDLDKLLSGQPGDMAADMAVVMTLLQAVQALDFARTPQAVLAARAQLGFGERPQPASSNTDALAKWIHLQVMAGEWEIFTKFMTEAAGADAVGIYAHILQSSNRPKGDPSKVDPPFLPEEILALADAAPGELSDWQFDVLSQLLKQSATKYSVGPMLAKIEAGTRVFGNDSAERRDRSVKFLVAAGLVVEAYKYFPSLDEARLMKDARLILNHAKYHEDLATGRRADDDADKNRRTAWGLYCEVALIASADVATRQEAMRRAIDLLPAMPPAMASDWLKQVFASDSLGPAALEVIALKAVSLRDTKLDLPQRAQIILTMKEAVDTLLAQQGVDVRMLKVPLHMLTAALVSEAEAALDDKNRPQDMFGGGGGGGVSKETELLFRALPDDKWLGVLEPSLATRAYKAAVGISTSVDETDVALDYVSHAVQRYPAQGVEFADDFLIAWQKKLVPAVQNDNMNYYFFWRDSVPAAPLTRGRQRRNLDRLSRLMTVLDKIGVESRRLPSVAAVFRACHGKTEVFTRDGITAVFGPLEKLAPDTASSLADQMRLGLSGDWRDKRAQQSAGMKRTPAELSAMVENGYALAIELIDHAMTQKTDSWRFAVTKAALTYDRLQYKQTEKKQDFATYNQYRKEAFGAFAQTADRYAEMVRKGDQREDATVYLAWFNAAVGSTELNYLTREDLLVEGSPQDDQIDLIKKSIASLPADAASRHTSVFARALSDNMGRLDPEVKPRIVRHAMRVVGDHPAGAPLRRLNDLYQDLVKDEIKLQLSVDGADRIGAGNRFGILLALRFSTSVDRETGGFSKYLQNDVWSRVGTTWRPMNYRDLFRKSIEASLGERFEVDSVGFFEPMTPARPVTESGDDGWLEKPMAYVVVRAKDPSVDRVPQVTMDMHFDDSLGPVTLPIISNSPPVEMSAASAAKEPRPVKKLEVTQTLDLRGMHSSKQKNSVLLEVHARGEGVIPELEDLLPGFRDALPGYEVSASGIEIRPVAVLQDDGDWDQRMFGGVSRVEKGEYAKADESGFYRLKTERSWLVTFSPTGASVGSEFKLASLNPAVKGALTSRQFSDMDIVDVSTATVAVNPPLWSRQNLIIAGIALVLALAGAAALYFRRKPVVAEDDSAQLPSRYTPLSVITTLRRVQTDLAPGMNAAQQQSLTEEIHSLERRYFGPQAGEAHANGDLRVVVEKWVKPRHG